MKVQVTQEVEATPELVKQLLTAHIQKLPVAVIPNKAGDFVDINPQVLNALHAIPDMPAMLISVAPDGRVGQIAYVTQVGQINMAMVIASQWKDYKPPEPVATK